MDAAKNDKDIYIKNVDEVDPLNLKCLQSKTLDTYFVRLKSDAEGGSAEKRQIHINNIFQLCCKYSRDDDTGREFNGIEVRFEEAMPAYAGQFHATVVSAIRDDKVCFNDVALETLFQSCFQDIVRSVDKKYEITMSSCIASRNWGTSKISLSETEFAQMPMKSGLNFSRSPNNDDKSYEYRWRNSLNQGSLGQGVTIYIIEQGGFTRTDFVCD